MQEALSTCLGEAEAPVLLSWILSMAADLQKDLRTGQGHCQEMTWDRGRVGEKHVKELGEMVPEGSGSISRTRGKVHSSAKAPSFEEVEF